MRNQDSADTQLALHRLKAVARAVITEDLMQRLPSVPTIVPAGLGSTVPCRPTVRAPEADVVRAGVQAALMAEAGVTTAAAREQKAAELLKAFRGGGEKRGVTHVYSVTIPALTLETRTHLITVPAQHHVLYLQHAAMWEVTQSSKGKTRTSALRLLPHATPLARAYHHLLAATEMPVRAHRGVLAREARIDAETWEAWMTLAAEIPMRTSTVLKDPPEQL